MTPHPNPSPLRHNYSDFFDAPWVGGIFRPLLIALLAASIVAGPLSLLRLFGVPWRLDYVLPFALGVTLEGVYSTLQLGRPTWRERRNMAVRLGEILTVLVLLRLVVWALSAGWPGLADFQLWLREPMAFFDAEYLILGAWILAVWALAVGITGDFLDLALQPDEIAAHDSQGWGESRSQVLAGRAVSRSDIVGRFATRWTVGGVVLVLFASLPQMSLALTATGKLELGLRGFGLSTELAAALVCYFLAGLLLISQGRLAVLRGRWYNQDIDVQPTVLRRWHTNSLFAVLLIGLVAALLPMGTTSWLSGIIEALVALVVRLGYLLLFLLMALFGLLLWPLRLLFRSGSEAPTQQMPPLEIPTQAEATSRLPDWLGGAILWIFLAVIATYLLLTFLNAHGLLQSRPAEWLMRLRLWWRARWAKTGAFLLAAAGVVAKRVQQVRTQKSIRSHSVHSGELTPRERVRQFYLQMLGRAAEQGLRRPAHQTPSEFVRQLEAEWPEAEAAVETLTAAFVAARYDRRPIAADEVVGVQATWRRVMQALRRQPQARHEDEE